MLRRFLDLIADQGGLARTIRKSLRAPGHAATSLARVLKRDYVKLLFDSPRTWQHYRRELAESGFLTDRLRALQARFATLESSAVRGHKVVPGQIRTLHAEILYALVRHRRPAVVVETGVCNGLSTAVILQAMSLNDCGKLHSVDLPEFTDPALNVQEFWKGKAGAAVPAGSRPGWLVEGALADRWSLSLGRSQEVLPRVLGEMQSAVDVFIHDSEHSYENQLFEFGLGYSALSPGGLLVATDINWSRAFEDFWSSIREQNARRAYVDAGCAVVRKGIQ